MLAEEQHTVYDRLHRRWTATKSLHKLLQTKRFHPNHSSSHYDGARGESEVRLRETWLSEANDLRSRRSPRANKGFAWLTTSLLYSYFATGRHALRRLVPSFTDRNVHFQHQSEAAQLKEWKLAVLSNFTITRDASVCAFELRRSGRRRKLSFTSGLHNLFSAAGHFHMRKFIVGHKRFCDVTITYFGVTNPLILISFMR